MKSLTIVFKDGHKRFIENVKDLDYYENDLFVYYLNSVSFLIFSCFKLSDISFFVLR